MKKIIAFILCTACLLFSACSLNEISSQNNNSSANTIENSSHSALNSNSENGEDVNVDIYNTIYNTYKVTQTSSMVLVEILNIGEVLSCDPSIDTNNCLMLECRVIEDYFYNLTADKIIYIPIMLPLLSDTRGATTENLIQFSNDGDSAGIAGNKTEQISGLLLSEFLKNYQQAIVYISRINETQRWYRNEAWDNPVQVDSVANMIFLDYEFIPITETIISLDELKNFCLANKCSYASPSDNIYNFNEFICNGMSFQKAKENIVSLYQSQIKGVID